MEIPKKPTHIGIDLASGPDKHFEFSVEPQMPNHPRGIWVLRDQSGEIIESFFTRAAAIWAMQILQRTVYIWWPSARNN